MKKLIGAAVIREYIFSSQKEKEFFVKSLRCDYKIHEEFEIEEGVHVSYLFQPNTTTFLY